MKKIKDDTLKSVLKLSAEETQLPADFTGMVMQTIEADTARELALKTVLKRHPAEGPAMDFTANILTQINAQPVPLRVVKPIITRKAWYVIIATIAFFVAMIFLAHPSAKAAKDSGIISSAMQYVSGIPTVYVLVVGMIGLLVLADYLISERLRNSRLSRA